MTIPIRHAELDSASTPPSAMSVPSEKWTLKQVQGDGIRFAVEALELFGIRLQGSVG